jgi:hypothetical protein
MNFLEVSAAEAFQFCADHGWNSSAWDFFYAWRAATDECRGRVLLGLPGVQQSDRKFVLSDDVLAKFCETRGWSEREKRDFSTKLWGTIF